MALNSSSSASEDDFDSSNNSSSEYEAPPPVSNRSSSTRKRRPSESTVGGGRSAGRNNRRKRVKESVVEEEEEEEEEVEVQESSEPEVQSSDNENDDNDNEDDNAQEEEVVVEFEGDENLDKDGIPLDGRELRMRSFTLPDRHPDRRYVLTLDLARAVGWNDSFRFLKDNPQVPRIIITNDEKEFLIQAKLVHPILRNRDVPVLSVAEAYLRFKTKIIRFPKKQRDPSELVNASDSQQHHSMEHDEFYYQRSLKRHNASQLINPQDMASRSLSVVLKAPQEVAVGGGDWMYRCALSAAEFNLQLRMERKDRLWGWTKGDDADEEEDENQSIGEDDSQMYHDSDSEPEHVNSKAAPKSKKAKQAPIKKHGFFDVHTNIHQLPVNTQLDKVTVQSAGIRVSDLVNHQKSKLNKEEEQKHRVVPDVGATHAFPAVHGRSPADMFGPEFSVKPEDAKKYPLALVPNQYQHSFSVYGTRFNLMPTPAPPQAAPAQQTPATQPTSTANAAATQQQQQFTASGRSRRLSTQGSVSDARVSASPAPEPKTPPPPEKPTCATCSEHILPESHVPKEILSSTELVKYDAVGCMRCFQYFHFKCLDMPHTARIRAKIMEYDWMCVDCRRCVECDDIKMKPAEGGDEGEEEDEEMEEELLFCDGCDRGYHISCLGMEEVPEGTWLCNECARCSSCKKAATPPENNDLKLHVIVAPRDMTKAQSDADAGETGSASPSKSRQKKGGSKKAAAAGGEDVPDSEGTYLTSLCSDCFSDWNQNCHCPVCLKTYPADEDVKKPSPKKGGKASPKKELQPGEVNDDEMVACDVCDRWVHFPFCDPELFDAPDGKKYLEDESVSYTCPSCRVITRDTGKKPIGSPRKKDAEITDNHPSAAPLQLDEEDEEQITQTHALKYRPKRRGRPPSKVKFADQLAQEQKLKAEYEKEAKNKKKPLRRREVVWYRGKSVVVPFMRSLKRWSEAWLEMK